MIIEPELIQGWAEGEYGEGYSTYAKWQGTWHSVNGTKHGGVTDIRWEVTNPEVINKLDFTQVDVVKRRTIESRLGKSVPAHYGRRRLAALDRMTKAKANPAVAAEALPPLYSLFSLTLMPDGRREIEVEPQFPVQICPASSSSIKFQFWGTDNYDVHNAFTCCAGRPAVKAITYDILYQGNSTRFRHEFKRHVFITIKGISSVLTIMKPFKSLDDMPELPYDWQYFQFVN